MEQNILQNRPELLTLLFAIGAKKEHLAIHYEDRIGLDTMIGRYEDDGFILKLRHPPIAFFQKDEGRIELIPSSFPEHEAWATKTSENWQNVVKLIENEPGLEILEMHTKTEVHLHVLMCKCKETDQHLQIIWREKQIFDDVFN